MNILIKFRHGLGDAVQLTTVLSHLKHYHPAWQIDVAAVEGKHSTFHGLCRNKLILGEHEEAQSQYDHVFDLDWSECNTCYADWPSTKVERCLLDVFRLTPIAQKCRYTIRRGEKARRLARRYLEDTCKVMPAADGRYPVVLIHYEGNTSAELKNLSHRMARQLCYDVLDCGAVPVILDWDHRSPLPDGERIHCPHADMELWGGVGTGDAQVLAALIEQAALMIGVDSGPLHVAGATTTPALGVWTGQHPLHHYGHADNVTHLVPENHVESLRGDRQAGQRYFTQHYCYRIYKNLQEELHKAIHDQLRENGGGLVQTCNFWIRANNARQDLVIVKDIAENDAYRIDALPMPRPVVLDVGAHIGVFSKKIHLKNPLARIVAVECCPENIPALKKNVGDFATVIQAAVTYERNVGLLNSVYSNCVSTGGCTVLSRSDLRRRADQKEIPEEPDPGRKSEYWADFRELKTLTLEQIVQEYRLDRIDILKLDCEGSEISILHNTELLDRIGIIVGEYHGKDAFLRLVAERFRDWHLEILKDGELGTFWLTSKGSSETEQADDPAVPGVV